MGNAPSIDYLGIDAEFERRLLDSFILYALSLSICASPQTRRLRNQVTVDFPDPRERDWGR